MWADIWSSMREESTLISVWMGVTIGKKQLYFYIFIIFIIIIIFIIFIIFFIFIFLTLYETNFINLENTCTQKGSHIYEVSDHGGLIVMSKDQDLTNELLYSWDEGSTFVSYIFQLPIFNSGRRRSRFSIFRRIRTRWPPVSLFTVVMAGREGSSWEWILAACIRGSAKDMRIRILVNFLSFF